MSKKLNLNKYPVLDLTEPFKTKKDVLEIVECSIDCYVKDGDESDLEAGFNLALKVIKKKGAKKFPYALTIKGHGTRRFKTEKELNRWERKCKALNKYNKGVAIQEFLEKIRGIK